jgi:phosphatidylcholine synthase
MGTLPVDAAVVEDWSPTSVQKAFAWATHTFTATGAVWGFLAILAVNEAQWRLAFFWICVAVLVDAVDGFIARAAHVKSVLPAIDGALLDNIIDYLNYVFVPAYLLFQTGRLPAQISLLVVFAILLSSAYQFTQADAKTDDHFFKGFPSYWNIIAFYLMVLPTNPWVNAAILLALVVLVFVPIKYIYPSRTSIFPRLTIGLGVLWGIANLLILWQYPNQAVWMVWLSLLYAVYYTGLSLYATFSLD